MNDKKNFYNQEEDDSSEGGEQGSSDQTHFHDPLSTPLRDDRPLKPHEKARLLKIHAILHKESVAKQKRARALYQEERQQMEYGRSRGRRNAMKYASSGRYSSSPFGPHPLLNNKVQFTTGQDKQIASSPTMNEANTNEDLRNELQLQLQNRLMLQMGKKFNPKLRPY